MRKSSNQQTSEDSKITIDIDLQKTHMVLLFLAKKTRENDSIDIISDLMKAWDLGWGFPPHQNMDNMIMIRHQIQGGLSCG